MIVRMDATRPPGVLMRKTMMPISLGFAARSSRTR
jgi:hypothetical protein